MQQINVAPSLTYIINLSLTTSTVPTYWKKAKVPPKYRFGSTTELENYRSISFVSVVSKIMEREVHCQLYEFLGETKLISKRQFGFQKKKSTKLAAIALLDQITLGVDNGNLVDVCFIDLKKPFDNISHNKLISKLERYRATDKELDCSTGKFEFVKMEVYLRKNLFMLVSYKGRSWDLCYLYCSSMTYQAILSKVKS